MIRIQIGRMCDTKSIHLIHPELIKLINLNTKSASLKYDIQIKLKKEVEKAFRDYNEVREGMVKGMAVEALYGNLKTKMKVEPIEVEVDGVTTTSFRELGEYNIPDSKMPELRKMVQELLDKEIELNCNPLSLKKLDESADCSELNFIFLEPFILDESEYEI